MINNEAINFDTLFYAIGDKDNEDGFNSFLKEEELNILFLKKIFGGCANLNIQSNYINELEKKFNIEISQYIYVKRTKQHKNFRNENIHCTLFLETGHIYTICPYTGTSLKSNNSFICSPVGLSGHFYHCLYKFESKKTFYLIFGSAFQTLLGIYFPHSNVIIGHDIPKETQKKNHYKGYLPLIVERFNLELRQNKLSENYLKTYLKTSEKSIALITGINKNFGHSYWNDLTGLHTVVTYGLLDKVSKILVGPYNTMDPAVAFPEIPESKIERFNNISEIQEVIIANNYAVTRPVDFYITEDLVNRAKTGSLKKCSPEFIESFESFKKQNYPLLWIALRSPNSKRPPWKSQVESLANIINKLYQDYPNLGIIFDGWSNLSVLTEKDQLMIEKERGIAKEIQSLIPQNIKAYNLIGATPYEKIVFADAVTTYIAPFGSTLTIVSWIADKVGVSYEGHKVLKKPRWRDLYSAGFREKMTSSTIVISEELVTQDKDGYECDEEWMYNQLKKLLNLQFTEKPK